VRALHVGPIRLSLVGPICLSLVGPILLSSVGQVRAQELTLDQLLGRVTSYVIAYQKALSGLVSEETYVQQWYRRADRMPETRTLRSDVLLTRPEGVSRFLLFRDVFEVDGRQVRDRDERLTQLFLTPAASTSTQVLRIIEEGARYNIGDITRTVNTPTLALAFLDPQYQVRFRFSHTADRIPETVRTVRAGDDASVARFTVPGDVAVIAYEELGPNTLIGTGNGESLPASGRYWVEPETGRLLMSEVIFRNATIEAIVDVKYELAPAVGELVPVVMRERYHQPRRNNLIEGSASYSRVRRFQVTATEVVAEPSR
jgi:hypothetical protein